LRRVFGLKDPQFRILLLMSVSKVTVVGSGYVGMANAAMLARVFPVTVLDIEDWRVKRINDYRSTLSDPYINQFMTDHKLDLSATLDKQEAYKGADFIFISVPADYDPETNMFDTTAVDATVHDALCSNSTATVVIKSTVPVGHTSLLQERHHTDRVIVAPEFLRENSALNDSLYPSRIVVGGCHSRLDGFVSLMKMCVLADDTTILPMSATEAEAVKLFANTYLAMRVAFFNELDSFALDHALSTQNIIKGVCSDDRISDGYNNPSFGFGGYCLPKDSKQLLANYKNTPQTLIGAVVSSNSARQEFIVDELLKAQPSTVGIFRLVMKEGSDNFRESAVQNVLKRIIEKGTRVVVYEPFLEQKYFLGAEVITDLDIFKSTADIIVANRNSDHLLDCQNKVFTRDIYREN
jgi:UDPglucose 6-dehydrogenase